MPLLRAIVWTVLHQSRQLLVRFDVPLLLVPHRSIQRYFPLPLVLCAHCSLMGRAKSLLVICRDFGSFLAGCSSNSAEDNRD
jgi:hypothetical protein